MRIHAVFYFAMVVKLYTVHHKVFNLFPNAFFDSPSLQALIPNPRTQPIGTAWILWTRAANTEKNFLLLYCANRSTPEGHKERFPIRNYIPTSSTSASVSFDNVYVFSFVAYIEFIINYVPP